MKKIFLNKINFHRSCKFTTRHKLHFDNLYDSSFKDTCIIGGSLSSTILSSSLFRIGKIGNQELKLFQKETFYFYKDLLPLFLFEMKPEEDINLPTLKMLNEFIDIDFENIENFSPDKNLISTFEKNYTYRNLVLAIDPLPDFAGIKGLENYLDPDEISYKWKVSSIHDFPSALELQNTLKYLDGGRIVFYQDSKTNFPYNILSSALLLQSHLAKKKNILNKTEIVYVTDEKYLMKNQKFSEFLEKILKEKNIVLKTEKKLNEVDVEKNRAFFGSPRSKKEGHKEKIDFSLLIVEPEYNYKSYNFLVQNSPFFKDGYFNFLENNTLRNKYYDNVFCMTTQLSKNSNFVCSQDAQFQMSFVIANNILATKKNKVTQNRQEYLNFEENFSIPIFTNFNKCLILEKNKAEEKIVEENFKNWAKFGYAYPYLFKRFSPKGRWFGPKLKFYRPKI